MVKKFIKNVFKWTVISLASIVALIAVVVGTGRFIVYCKYHVRSKNGIDKSYYVTIEGQKQFVRVRGEDLKNPVIIFLHGGPGQPMSYISHIWQKFLMSSYTFVEWDQRGCGRTYYKNINLDQDNKSVTFEQAVTDLNGVVEHICQTLGKEKIIIMGHSYGSVLGSSYVRKYPDRVSAFVPVSMCVCLESDVFSYEDALVKARLAGDETKDMEDAFAVYQSERTLDNMLSVRKYTGKYHPDPKNSKNSSLIVDMIFSPYMNLFDMRWFLLPATLSDFMRLEAGLVDYWSQMDLRKESLEYNMPVYFISGTEDWTSPVMFMELYAASIKAPKSIVVKMTGSGHVPFLDSPQKFAEEVKKLHFPAI